MGSRSSEDETSLIKELIVCTTFLCLTQLAYETHKARKVIASRDISYAFTNIMANGYYSLREDLSSSNLALHSVQSVLIAFTLPSFQARTRTSASSVRSTTRPRRRTTLPSSSSSPSKVSPQKRSGLSLN